MKIIVTGGTGFVGREVVRQLLERGDEVTVFTRQSSSVAEPQESRLSYVQWDPTVARLPAGILDGAQAIIHLAGEVAVGRRLTSAVQHQVRESRLASTSLLAAALEEATTGPRVFVSCSAVGYYGSRPPAQLLTERDGPGRDFLAQLCVDWEDRSKAAPPTTRVVNPRLGIVFGPGGGALEAMALPFRLFIGGPLGDGRQIISWVHLHDVARALIFCVDNEKLSGPVNVTAPHPVDNRTLSEIVGKVLHRPSALPTPAFALRALFGEGAAPLLEGQRVEPRKLLDAGFEFRFNDAKQAVEQSLSHPDSRTGSA